MNSAAIMINEYLANHGARRFEAGARTEYEAIRAYLRDRFYDMRQNGRTFSLKPLGQKGAGKRMSWQKVMAFVDELRAAEGLEPFARKNAA
jgi:hypothetical protein